MESIYITDEHVALREQVARFVAREVEPVAEAWEEQGAVPREVLRRMGALGLFGITYPEQYGGLGVDALTSLVFAEELSRSTFGGFCVTVLVHTDMASPHLVHAGTPEQLERYLPGVIRGELITAVGVTEPDAGSDVKAIRTRLNMTQEEFAGRFGFSVNTLRHWEQGSRQPEGPTRAYLLVIERAPKAVQKALQAA